MIRSSFSLEVTCGTEGFFWGGIGIGQIKGNNLDEGNGNLGAEGGGYFLRRHGFWTPDLGGQVNVILTLLCLSTTGVFHLWKVPRNYLLVFHPPFTWESGVKTVWPIGRTNCSANF